MNERLTIVMLGALGALASCTSQDPSSVAVPAPVPGQTGGRSAANPSPSVAGAAPDPSSGPVFLGRPCMSELDCGFGLICLKAEAPGEGGPANGYCTASCSDDAACRAFAPETYCVPLGSVGGQCVLACAGTGDPTACQGRTDVACTVLDGGVGRACLPRCNSDLDCCTPLACGSAGYCDPRTGLCKETPRDGDATGEACSADNAARCRGVCNALGEASSGQAVLACADLCTVGGSRACGWAPSEGPAGAACLSGQDGLAPLPGNAGLCIQLCDTDADCLSQALRCRLFQDPADRVETRRAGRCDAPEPA